MELTKDMLMFEDDIELLDKSINFYISTTKLGILDRFVSNEITASEDGWFNVYADYYPETKKVIVTTVLDEPATSKDWEEEIIGSEKEILLDSMNEYCYKQTGFNMDNYWGKFIHAE